MLFKTKCTIWHGLFTVFAVLLLVGIPVSAVSAAPAAEDGEHLESLFQREQELLKKQEERLAKANEVISRVEEYISNQAAAGADTSGAEQALAAFESALPGIQSYFDEAAAILNAHAGFDSDGNVTDSIDALETVSTAGSAQRQFHLNLVQAFKDLRESLKDSHTYFRLEEGYQKLLEVQQAQADALAAGEDAIERLETFITEQQDMGCDTSGLETAKEAFLMAYDLASGNHDEAGGLLDAHEGFDSQGVVTDPDQAQITVCSAGSAQRQFHLTAAAARISLRDALEEYRDTYGKTDA